MNKKAQAGPIAYIFLILVVIILWFVWIGEWLTQVGENAISSGGLSGIEAFFFANLNVWFFVALILGTIGYMYFVGGSG